MAPADETDPKTQVPAEGETASDEPHEDIDKMSFEEAMRELETIVQRLESGEIDLEESIEIYSRGNRLKQHCEAKLKAAQSKVEKIVGTGESGQPTETEPYDVE